MKKRIQGLKVGYQLAVLGCWAVAFSSWADTATNNLNMNNNLVVNHGYVNAGDQGLSFTNSAIRGITVSAGQLSGVNPQTGEMITNAANLLPLKAQSLTIVDNGVLSGNGSGLTNLPASALSGTIDAARLPNTGVWNAAGLTVSNLIVKDGFGDGGEIADKARSLGNKNSYSLSLLTAGQPQLTLTPAGLVGIGTETPLSKLQVSGTIQAGAASAPDGGVLLQANYDGDPAQTILTERSTGAIGFGQYMYQSNSATWLSSFRYGPIGRGALLVSQESLKFIAAPAQDVAMGVALTTQPTTKFLIDSSGNVGIGTETPLTKLHIDGTIQAGAASATLGSVLLQANYGGDPAQTILTERSTGAIGFGQYMYQNNSATWLSSFRYGPLGRGALLVSQGELKFISAPVQDVAMGVALTTQPTTKFVINSYGNVGIGTEIPSAKLDVAGTIKATTFVGDGSGLTNVYIRGTLPDDVTINWNSVLSRPSGLDDGDQVGITTEDGDARYINVAGGFSGEAADLTNMGTIRLGEILIYRLNYVAEDNQTKIRTIKPSCSCITVLSRPDTLQAGETGIIELKIAAETEGDFRYEIQVFEEGVVEPRQFFCDLSVQSPAGKDETGSSLYISIIDPVPANRVWVDIRSAEAYEKAHIPDSLSMPLYAVKTKSFLRGQDIVLVDEGWGNPIVERACRDIRRAGFPFVRILRGGLAAWHKAGRNLNGLEVSSASLVSLRPTDFLSVRNRSKWQVIHIETNLTAAEQRIGAVISIPYRPGQDRQFLQAVTTQLSHNSENNPVLILSENGQHDAKIHRQIALLPSATVFYLEGGREGLTQALDLLDGKSLAGKHTVTTRPSTQRGGRPQVLRKSCGSCPG